jgi:ferric-dicitrate binding protein FerR (iron transport regulator)
MADEEDVTAHLLRLVGAPPEPPGERRARVRAAVHDAWRAQRRQRIVRRSAAAIVLLGVAAALMIAVRIDRARPEVARPSEASLPSATILATAARIQGRPALRSGDGKALPLTAAMPIHVNDVIETDNASRASLQMADGSSLRIDRGTSVRIVARSAIELGGGAAYLETSEGSHGFEIRTSMGTVRDVGTRFEVRLMDSGLRLRVRTGMVQIARGRAVSAAAAGTETTVTATGTAVRQMPPYGPEWAWVATLASPFAIEGHSLRAFLEHTASEEGWTLRYASPAVAEAADRILLHGSVDGLGAEDALEVALATSGLQYRLRDGELLVSRPSEPG